GPARIGNEAGADSMSMFRDQVKESLRALEILTPTQFSWIGKPSEPLPDHILATIKSDAARAFLLYGIQMRLYDSFYCRGVPRRMGWDRVDVRIPGLTTYMTDALIAANHGRPYVEPGWTVTEIGVTRDSRVAELVEGRTQVRVRRGGLTLRAQPEECIKTGGGTFTGARGSGR